MIRIVIIGAIAAASITTLLQPAHAQPTPAFTGKCTDYRTQGKDACNATDWCIWRTRKPITLPNGQTITPQGACAFKPGHKAAFAASK